MGDRTLESRQSNEEIIEELTRNLEEQCIKVDDNQNSHDRKISEVATSLSEDPWEKIVNTSDDEKNEKLNNEIHDEPFDVDEEYLKDREINLSEIEKEELKETAERLKNEGNILFKDGEYLKAISTYTKGLQTCPLAYNKDRSILFANRATAKSKCMEEKESAIADCSKAIELNPNYVKAYLRRAQLYESTDKLDEALEDFKKILTFDPANSDANIAIRRLPPLIQERNEKLKNEMLGKLKDLGNMVLKPFGLSTNNFELQQDPNSGGYSVKFHQNPR